MNRTVRIAGHEPCGQIVNTGQGMKRFKVGDHVVVYHISGCGFGTVYEGIEKIGVSGKVGGLRRNHGLRRTPHPRWCTKIPTLRTCRKLVSCQ